jgi:hypothetical protein
VIMSISDPIVVSSSVSETLAPLLCLRNISGPMVKDFVHEDHEPASSVRIATSYGLGGPGIESRWGARFSEPVQTGPGAHTPSCTMGTRSFPAVESLRGVTLTPNPLLVQWS